MDAAGAQSGQTAVVELKDPVATTEDCRYCWMCRHVCPVGHVTQRETLTPHGWALTIASVRRGTLRWNEETTGVLYSCADCGLCRAHCLTDRPLPDAIAATRAEVAAAGLAPPIVYELNEKLQRWGNPYAPLDYAAGAATAPAATRTPAAASAIATVVAEHAPAPAPASASGADPASESQQAVGNARAGQARGDVALFVGDAARHLGPREIDAARALLAAIGITPVLIGDGRSTGLLASALGLRETAETLARGVLDEIEAVGCRELLVLAPADRYAFERVYRDRLEIAWPANVTIKEVTTLLAEAHAAGRLAFRAHAHAHATAAAAYAYHDPCHSPRIDRDGAAPRALLNAALGASRARNLFWREHRAHPCGATGGLEFTQPVIAAKLADARLSDTVAAGASWLITDDPACAHHLRKRPQTDVTVLGLYELLAERLSS
jgi:Fe-S oxidoreductase